MHGIERLALDPEELLDRALGLRVAALAEVDVGEVAGPVEEVARRPALVVVGAPELEARVQEDRVLDVEARERSCQALT
jgi:hypothetical protein